MKTILIVEDNAVIANIYERKLAADGFKVVTHTDGKAAVDALDAIQPDLVLLDLMLPRMSGPQVMRTIRRHPTLGDIPIVVLTNADSFYDLKEAKDAGATEVLCKSANQPMKEVLDIIKRRVALSRRKAAPPAAAAAAPAPEPASPPATPAEDPFQVGMSKAFFRTAPRAIETIQQQLREFIKDSGNFTLLRQLYDNIHALTTNAEQAGLQETVRVVGVFDGLVRELYERRGHASSSLLRTMTQMAGILAPFVRQTRPEGETEPPPAAALVVDEQDMALRDGMKALEQAHLNAVCARDVASATELAFDQRMELFVINVKLPDMSGLDFCARLRANPQYTKTPCIFVGDAASFNKHAEAVFLRGDDMIVAPFLLSELAAKAVYLMLRRKLNV